MKQSQDLRSNGGGVGEDRWGNGIGGAIVERLANSAEALGVQWCSSWGALVE